MKALLLQLAAYNIWANQLLLDAIKQIGEEKQKQKLSSSFSNLFEMVLHLYDAENIWWQRMKLLEHVAKPSDYFSGDMQELSITLLHQNKQWQDWIANANEHQLTHVFQYQNSKKQQFKQPVYQMLLHVFNHGTYHRGQLVNMLRQVGVEKIPATDFIVWSRKR